jgi:hypothetical protein
MEQKFTLTDQDKTYDVSVHAAGKATIYRVDFTDGRKPLVITYASDSNGRGFWTSVPQGRQQEAEEFGNLIDIHQKK